MGRLIESLPGLALVALLAVAAWLISDVFGGSALLYGVLLGLLAHPLVSSEGALTHPWVSGAGLAANQLLKLGVALLGARITLDQLLALGWEPLLLVLCAIPLVLRAGVAAARLLGERRDLGLLTGGSVAICGASAALAVAAVLPQNDHNRRSLALVIIAVTVLSLAAMLIYPVLAHWLGLSGDEAGLLLGGSIHNVPQAVAAGFIHGQAAGETATFVKLLRVAMLVPVVMVLAAMLRSGNSNPGGGRKALLPWFLWGFLVLVGLNSLGLIGRQLAGWLETGSDALLLTALVAIGLQSSIGDLRSTGWRPLVLMLTETLLLLGMVLLFVLL